jgi:transcriptional regulator with XRE-family HTH domain
MLRKLYAISYIVNYIGRYIMAKPAASSTTPIPVRRAMRKLGQDIRDARLRRRIPTEILAQRASISRMTLYKVENGDVNVSMGTYAKILFVLGLIDRVGNLADASEDTLGRQLEEERLPKRIRLPRKKTEPPGDVRAS